MKILPAYLIKIQPRKISDTVNKYPQAVNRNCCGKKSSIWHGKALGYSNYIPTGRDEFDTLNLS
jgi:hypothetical protein